MHWRVFECVSYVHVAKEKRGKLDPRSWPCIFLGYNIDEFGYRLWDLIDKKVIRSQDIDYKEEKTIADWETEKLGFKPALKRPTISVTMKGLLIKDALVNNGIRIDPSSNIIVSKIGNPICQKSSNMVEKGFIP